MKITLFRSNYNALSVHPEEMCTLPCVPSLVLHYKCSESITYIPCRNILRWSLFLCFNMWSRLEVLTLLIVKCGTVNFNNVLSNAASYAPEVLQIQKIQPLESDTTSNHHGYIVANAFLFNGAYFSSDISRLFIAIFYFLFFRFLRFFFDVLLC